MGASGSSGGPTPAGGMSLASAGLSAYSTVLQSQGTATADDYQAERLDNAATYGNLKAVQTGGQMTRNLNQTLGNIDAVRAAANADPSSPTGAAFRDNQENIGNTNRGIAVSSILQQSQQETADAAYYRQASSSALLSGDIGAAAGIFGAISPLLKGLGGGGPAPAGNSIGNPAVIGSLY
jgi:hypothetical protein